MMGLILWIAEAWARAGGGGGYSGGGGGGGGGSYSGGGSSGEGSDALVRLLIYLVIEVPIVGVPLLIVVVVGFIWFHSNGRGGGGGVQTRIVARGPARVAESASTSALLRHDPGFSEVLFLDFARLVFVRAHEERGRKNLGALAAVLSPTATQALSRRSEHAVRDVIIGSVRLRSVRVAGEVARAGVSFAANYSEEGKNLYIEETWIFERAADTRSPGPELMQALRCPSCGSALETKTDGSCVSCGTPLSTGKLLWRAVSVDLLQLQEVPRVQLSLGGGTEAGTNLPLVRAPDFAATQRALASRHPEFDLEAFRARVVDVFVRVQAAWSDMKPEAVRPLETDGVFQSHRYWIERYRREGLCNRGAGVKVTGVLPARIQMDAYYTAITVRIFASMLDWTEDRGGKVVGGSKSEPKRFSEYWTFVRAAGKPLTTRENVDACPSCGAPLDRVGEGGVCGYCEAKITSGDFDWVLAAIDQDDAYGG